MRGTLEGTLDAHARRDVARDGVDAAARAIVEELPGPRSLVRLAYDPAESSVGITVPGLRPWGADISFVGVLPEHRGNGYADELLLEASHLLVEGGPQRSWPPPMWATHRWRRRSRAAGTWWSTG